MDRFQVLAKLCDSVRWYRLERFRELLDLLDSDYLLEEEGCVLTAKAARYAEYATIKLLLEKGAKVNSNTAEKTPLHNAVKYDIKIVKLLLQHNADVGKEDRLGRTPLHIAVKITSVETATLLLDKKADTNARDHFGRTPLHYAVNRRCKETVGLLLRNGADVNLPNQSGRTPLHAAVIRGYAPIVKMLLHKQADVNSINFSGRTPIFFAADRGLFEITKLLVENGASVNVVDHSEHSPLHFAVDRGHVKVVELLLQKEAAITAAGPELRTPLHEAVDGGHSKIVKLLLKRGEGVNAADSAGTTPLHGAVDACDVKIVKRLLHKGASANAADRFERTPLYIAVNLLHGSRDLLRSQMHQKEIVKLLLENGASVNAAHPDDGTPLNAAVKGERVEIVELLLEKQAEVNDAADEYGNTPLHHAVYLGNVALVKMILHKGAAVNAVERLDGETPLHVALKADSINDLVDLLLSYGANVHACDLFYQTPLFFAIEHCNSDVVKKLVKHCTNSGHDSLDHAVQHRNESNREVSDPSDVTDDANVASANDCPEIIEQVLKHCATLNNTQNCDVLRAVAMLDHKPFFKDIPVVKTLLTYGFPFANEVHNANFINAVIGKRCDNVLVELLKNGFDVNRLYTMDCGGSFLPLHLAVEEICVNAARLLISHGADVNSQNAQGDTAILSLTLDEDDSTDFQICELLLKNQSNAIDNSKFLVSVIESFHRIDIVELLLKYGTDVNWKDSEGSTALHHAVLARGSEYSPRLDHVKLLLTSGADVNSKTNADVSVLHVAALLDPKYIEVFKTLLECNPDVNASCDGVTPLHLCALTKNVVFCQLLLSEGANVNAILNNKKTALHVAVSKNPCSVAFKTFLEGLQSFNFFNSKTVLNWTTVEKGLKFTFPKICNVQMIDDLLNCGAEINSKDFEGKTTLHYAAENSHSDHLRALIQHGADVMARDQYFKTALHYTEVGDRSSLRIVRALVSAGADINCRDSDGCTLLHKLVQTAGQFPIELVELGSDVNAFNHDKRTPLEEARRSLISFCRRKIYRYNAFDENSDSTGMTLLSDYAIPCLMQHIVKLKAACRYVDRKNLRALGGVCYDDFYNKCKQEITSMKVAKIGESNMSYYDVLRCSRNQIARVANYVDLVKALEESRYDEKFPIYASDLSLVVLYLKQADRRKRLLDSSIEVFRSCIFELPVECVDLIFDDMSDGDLVNVMVAFYPDLVFPGEANLMCDNDDGYIKDKFTKCYSGNRGDGLDSALYYSSDEDVIYDDDCDRDVDSDYERDYGMEYWRESDGDDASSDGE